MSSQPDAQMSHYRDMSPAALHEERARLLRIVVTQRWMEMQVIIANNTDRPNAAAILAKADSQVYERVLKLDAELEKLAEEKTGRSADTGRELMSRYRLETTDGYHTIKDETDRHHWSFDELQDALDALAYLQLAETVQHLGDTDAKRLDTLRIFVEALTKAMRRMPGDRSRQHEASNNIEQILQVVRCMVGEPS